MKRFLIFALAAALPGQAVFVSAVSIPFSYYDISITAGEPLCPTAPRKSLIRAL